LAIKNKKEKKMNILIFFWLPTSTMYRNVVIFKKNLKFVFWKFDEFFSKKALNLPQCFSKIVQQHEIMQPK
jgi:hypothetical protein